MRNILAGNNAQALGKRNVQKLKRDLSIAFAAL